MKKVIVSALVLAMIAGVAWSLEGDDGQKLSGRHENLNIIGVDNPKKIDFDGVEAEHGVGHVIFVNLDGWSKINLVESGTDDAPGIAATECAVLDKNGTDNDGATFALPDPGLEPYVVDGDVTEDTITNYSIFVRPLGKPEGWARITTCAGIVDSALAEFLNADDIDVLNRDGHFGGVASIESTGQLLREKGQSVFTNQTAALLTIVLKVMVDYEDDGIWDATLYVRVPIYDDMLYGEYWEYENHGLKLLQVRIYRVGTDVSNYDDPTAWDSIPLP